jgi:hypothetical protein
MECVESMVFDAKQQAKEGGMQVLQQCYFILQGCIFFHFGYQYDVNGQTRITMCSKAHPRVKTLFVQCGGLVLAPLNDMEVLTHILDG